MGTQVTIPDVDMSASAAEWLAPVDQGLLFANFFGAPGATARNLATGGGATIFGSPAAAGLYAGMGSFGYLDSGIAEQPYFTFLAAFGQNANNPDNIVAMAVGNTYANGKNGCGLFQRTNYLEATVTGTASDGTTPATTDLQLAGAKGTFWLGAARFDGLNLTLDNVTNNARVTGTMAGARQFAGATLQVGSGYGVGNNSNIIGAAVYNRALTDAELALMVTAFRAYGVKVGASF